MKIEIHNMITRDLLSKYNNGTLASRYKSEPIIRRHRGEPQETHVDHQEVIEAQHSTIIGLYITLILALVVCGLFAFWAYSLHDSIVWHQHLEHKEEKVWQSN